MSPAGAHPPLRRAAAALHVRAVLLGLLAALGTCAVPLAPGSTVGEWEKASDGPAPLLTELLSIVGSLQSAARSRRKGNSAVQRSITLPVYSRLVMGGAPWPPRDSADFFTFNDRIWIGGGWVTSFQSPLPDVWSYSGGSNWTEATAGAPWTHSDFAVSNLVFEGRMWHIGGWADGRLPNASASSSVWASEDGKHWECVTPAAPWDPREAATGVVFKGEIWIMGGTRQYYYSNNTLDLRNDVWHSKDGKHWVQATAAAAWPPRAYLNAVVLHDTMYVLSGGNWQTSGCISCPDKTGYFTLNDVWKTTDGVVWSPCTRAAPWLGRIWFGATVWRDEIWVVGGTVINGTYYSNKSKMEQPIWTNVNDTWHSADGEHWVRDTSPGIWTARHAFGLYAWRGALWVAAGNDWEVGILNELWKLQPTTPWVSGD